MSDVFVCYATADRQHARKLVEALRAEGFDVWWDDQMIPGETVDDRVKTQLDLAKAVVVIWSPYASAEELVRDVAERARDSDKLISTVVEGYDRTIIPAGLRRRHWVHLDEHDKILGALDRLAIGRTQPKRVPDVLISYSHTERSLAETLAQSLRAQGIDVWWDDSLVSGEDYGARINERLDSAKAVIVIWSPASVKSDWVRDEAERALTANKLVSVARLGPPLPALGRRHNFLAAQPLCLKRRRLRQIRLPPLRRKKNLGRGADAGLLDMVWPRA